MLSERNKFDLNFSLFIFSDFLADICYTVIVIVLKNRSFISELGAQYVEREKTFKNQPAGKYYIGIWFYYNFIFEL